MTLDEVNKSVGRRVVGRHGRVTLEVSVNHLCQLLTEFHAVLHMYQVHN